MKFEVPKIWCERLNAGDLEGVLSLYDENALLFATFDVQPLVQPEQRRKYFEGFLARPGAGVEVDETTLVHSRHSGWRLSGNRSLRVFLQGRRRPCSTTRSFYLYRFG